MTNHIYSATVLDADGAAGRFVVLKTSHDERVVYGHWKTFRDAGFTSVQPGQQFEIQVGLDEKDNQTPIVSKVSKEAEARIGQLDQIDDNRKDTERRLTSEELRSRLCDGRGDLIVIRKETIEEFETRDLRISAPVVFIDCCFEGNFRLMGAHVQGGIWFLNCIFKYHFSLRGAHINGNAVLFGCDFRGSGGISFRGLQGRSIFLEHGIRGGDDMLWFNELSLSGCVAISGTFSTRVEILARQDDNPVNSDPKLNRVVIGKDGYSHENLSENQFLGGIECRGYQLQGSFEIHNSIINDLVIDKIGVDHIVVDGCEISRDVVLDHVQPNDQTKGIAVTHCIIERHLRLTAHGLRGRLDLSDTSVGHMWMLKLDEPISHVPQIRLKDFHAGSALFQPVRLIYGAVRRRRFFAPPALGFLAMAKQSGSTTNEDRQELADAYTSCKNWLATSGHLLEEDHAFFHMRNARERWLLKRCLLGGIFGWGIYLRNILLSAAGLVALFALLYTLMGVGALPDMMVLSAQSFISSFFGEWPAYPPVGILSVMITLESMLGVIFITILVGAYIRKLLR